LKNDGPPSRYDSPAIGSTVAAMIIDCLQRERGTEELGLDFYGFRARIAEPGVRYVDEE